MIYFDNAATTLMKPPGVAKAMAAAVRALGSPGRGAHPAALRASEEAYACRRQAAAMFGVPDPASVVFCMNATHALNIAVKSLVNAGDRVVITGYEHNAVLRPLTAVDAKVAVAAAPLFRPDEAIRAFRQQLSQGAKAAVVNHVSNVFGYIQPLAQMASICRELGVPLIVDASQSAGVLPLDMKALGAAFICMPGHKGLFGPQGTGLLLCGAPVHTLLEGGSGSDSKSRRMPDFLPDRLEAGTHNMPGIAGLRQGLRFVERMGTASILERERSLLRMTADCLSRLPRIRLYRAEEEELQTGVLSFTVHGQEPEETAELLAGAGFCVRAGLHCAPLAHETAGSSGTVRLSFSVFNGPAQVESFWRYMKENFR